MRALRVVGLLALVGLAANCGGGDSGGPEPGFLTLTLNTPNFDDGALLFKVVGGEVDSVVAGGPMTQEIAFTVQPSFTRVVVAGSLVDGVVARAYVPDVNNAADYSVVIEQIAVRNTFTQRATGGYSVTVSAP